MEITFWHWNVEKNNSQQPKRSAQGSACQPAVVGKSFACVTSMVLKNDLTPWVLREICRVLRLVAAGGGVMLFGGNMEMC
ncbi:hypothetical protein SCA6_006145 [Theobroma cacao]